MITSNLLKKLKEEDRSKLNQANPGLPGRCMSNRNASASNRIRLKEVMRLLRINVDLLVRYDFLFLFIRFLSLK
jgi:hypothetical protein